MKYNLNILTNQKIGIKGFTDKPVIKFTPIKIKSKKDYTIFNLESGYKIEFQNDYLKHMSLSYKDNIYWLEYTPSKISGLFVFTMFDTYGFPPELVEEILGEEVDYYGFELCRNLQKNKSKNSFKNKENVF